jgi:hypothetical protein
MVCDQNLVFGILKHTIVCCVSMFLLCKEFFKVFIGIWILVFCK